MTIGRGYDLGQRPNLMEDLQAAGIVDPLLSWLVEAKGLRGLATSEFLAKAPSTPKKTRITRKQQYELFLNVYMEMKREVVRISNKDVVEYLYGVLDWDSVHVRIQDVLIDLKFRGDYDGDVRRFLQKPFVLNDYETIRSLMVDRKRWPTVATDRFQRRAGYL